MQLTELKKSLWGYQKESVYQYIAALDGAFSEKLAHKDKETKERIRELEERNRELERENEEMKKETAELKKETAEMRKENEEFKKLQFAISDSILDAQNYAAQLKNETELKERNLRSQVEEEAARQRRRVEFYADEISALQNNLKEVLKRFDDALQNTKESASKLSACDPLDEKENAVQVDRSDENKKMGQTAGQQEQRISITQEQTNLSLFKKKSTAAES